MNTLAAAKVAVPSANSNSPSKSKGFGNIKSKALNAVKSIAIAVGSITASLVVGTASLASTNQQSELRYGKLTLVNDTPSPMLVYLKAPKEDRPTRYAYVAACTTRILTRKYSTGWRVTTDKKMFTPLREIRSGQLEARASRLPGWGGVGCKSSEVLDALKTAAAGVSRSVDSLPEARYIQAENIFQGFKETAKRHIDVALYADKYIAEPSKLLAKITSKNGLFTSPEYQYLRNTVAKECPVECDTVTKNQILINLNKYTIEEIKHKMYAIVQQLAQQAPGKDSTNNNSIFVDVLVNAARYHNIDVDEVSNLVVKYLKEKCLAWEETAKDLMYQWKTLRITMTLYTEAIIPMSAPTPQVIMSNGATQTPTILVIISGQGCVIRGPAASPPGKVVSFLPGKQ